MSKSPLFATLAGAIVSLVLAACGGDDRVTTEVSRDVTPSPTTAESPEASPTEPTASPTPTAPTPAPTPRTVGPKVEVANFHVGSRDEWSLTFLGEVTNNGDEDAASIQVVLTLTDAQGNVVGTGTGECALSIISPGETVPFSIYVDNPPQSWAEEQIQVQAEAATAWDTSFAYSDFKVSGVTVTPDEYGGVSVRGIVENTGTETASLIEVNFAAYDSAGQIQALDSTYTDLDELAPGGTSPFEIRVYDLDAVPASHIVFVEGWSD